MISISEALDNIRRETPVLASERMSLDQSVGRILAEDIIADDALPPFDRSQMDGFAVIAADAKKVPVTLRIVGESAAGRGWHKKLKKGEAVRIMTGAPVPTGADAVQKIELTRSDGDTVTILESVKNGTHIVKCGAEVSKGKRVITAGTRITSENISVVAAFGYAKVRVRKQPRVAILSTGSEIVPVDRKPGRDKIRNSNSVMLEALCRKSGAAPRVLPSVADDLKALTSAIRGARSEILIITGGVSVGKYDLTKAALADLGAEIVFEKVRLKPGKPAVFARLGKTLVFGLPGNPVSSAVTFQLFVRMAIVLMQGVSDPLLRTGHAILSSDTRGARDRDTFLPASLDTDSEGRLTATPLKWLGSSDFIGYSRAEALIFVPAGKSYRSGDVAKLAYLD